MAHQNRRESFLNTRHFLRAVVVVVMAMAVAFPVRAAADDTNPAAYRQAVEATLALVRDAQPNDTDAARLAVTKLKLGTGVTQPEVLADLQQIPPDFEDAARRLQALLNALTIPADTTEPVQAKQRLDEVLTMPRYDALHRPPSLLDRLRQWVDDRLSQLLNAMRNGAGPSSVPDYVFYAIGTIVVAVVAILIFRASRGRLSDGALSSRSAGPRAPADYFAEADRLAAAGDRVGAIRALCAGVAATLAGERTWEGSPLTVREIFQRAPDPASLRPLLAPFEAAIYGGRDVDQATYARAVKVAAPFRQPAELAA